VRLLVSESGSRDLVRDLSRGELDLALVIVSPAHADAALTTTPILREQLVVASTGEGAAPVRLAELREQQLVMFRDGYDLREATLAACRRAGFEPRFSVEGGEMDAVLRFVEAGLGVAVVPSMALAGRPKLRGAPLAGRGMSRTIALARRTDVQPTHAAQAFLAVLRGFLADAVAEGHLPPGVNVVPQ
jgi:DNA-binding transcriptional LysR family regulator